MTCLATQTSLRDTGSSSQSFLPNRLSQRHQSRFRLCCQGQAPLWQIPAKLVQDTRKEKDIEMTHLFKQHNYGLPRTCTVINKRKRLSRALPKGMRLNALTLFQRNQGRLFRPTLKRFTEILGREVHRSSISFMLWFAPSASTSCPKVQSVAESWSKVMVTEEIGFAFH